MLPSLSAATAHRYVEGEVYSALKLGASSSTPSLRMATPLARPFSKSSNFDCCQVSAPSARAHTTAATITSAVKKIFIERIGGELLKITRIQLHTLCRLRIHRPSFIKVCFSRSPNLNQPHWRLMRRLSLVLFLVLLFSLAPAIASDPAPAASAPANSQLDGYTTQSSQAERDWEAKFKAIPSPENLRVYMQRLSARPHHVGSPYDKENAEWILARFKEWGLPDAHIESFDVLFPTPAQRVV